MACRLPPRNPVREAVEKAAFIPVTIQVTTCLSRLMLWTPPCPMTLPSRIEPNRLRRHRPDGVLVQWRPVRQGTFLVSRHPRKYRRTDVLGSTEWHSLTNLLNENGQTINLIHCLFKQAVSLLDSSPVPELATQTL